jgi:hypothetical protein
VFRWHAVQKNPLKERNLDTRLLEVVGFSACLKALNRATGFVEDLRMPVGRLLYKDSRRPYESKRGER